MSSTRAPRRRRGALALVALAAAASLTGCGSIHPGDAAAFADRSISFQQVDDLASAVCSANLQGADPAQAQLPTKAVRLTSLRILLDSQLSLEFGEVRGVKPDSALVAKALASNAGALDQLPVDRQEAFREGLNDYADATATLVVVGRESLAKQGQAASDISNEAALSEGTRLRSQWVKTLEVDVDPRFGEFRGGTVMPADASLSVAQSAEAKAAAKAKPGAAYTASLPANLTCR